MTPAKGMELARQVHAQAEAYGVDAWCAAVDVLNSGDEADQQRARELMVFVRHHQQVQVWAETVPSPAQLAPKDWHAANDQRRPDTGSTVRRGGIPPLSDWLGALALFALLWIALAGLT